MTINNNNDFKEGQSGNFSTAKTAERLLSQIAPGIEIKSEDRQILMDLIRSSVENGKPLDEDPGIYDLAYNFLQQNGYSVVSGIDDISLKPEGAVDVAAMDMNRLVTRAKVQDKIEIAGERDYKSNVGVYGFHTRLEGDRLVYERSLIDSIVMAAETFIRKNGDLGGSLLGSILKTPLRHKASPEEIGAAIEKLGLQKYFAFEKGKLSEDEASLKDGVFLDDILRKRNDSKFLGRLDLLEALTTAVQILEDLHKKTNCGIGEALANDFLLTVADGKIQGGRIAMPDVAYGEHVKNEEQKATDLLDLCFSAGSAAMQNGNDDEAKKSIETVLGSYEDEGVKTLLMGLAAHGRPFATVHNFVRLGFDRVKAKKEAFERTRKIIIDALKYSPLKELPSR